jgi:monoamine oxidase
LRGLFLADPAMLSSLVVLELLASGSDPGRLFRVRGGNDHLIAALDNELDRPVMTRHVVRAIRQSPSGVRVSIESPDHLVDHDSADYAIVTAPVPVVLTWELEPALPEPQRRALESLSYGPATKLLMRFASRWWRRQGRPRAFGTNLLVGAVWESGEEQRDAALLTLLAGGRASAQLQSLLDIEGIAGIVERLRWLGRSAGEEPFARLVAWERDEWARGGYAVLDSRFEPAWVDLLGRAFGRVLFAGEHTSREWQGYMNGAVESGQRVAAELVDLQRIRRMGA